MKIVHKLWSQIVAVVVIVACVGVANADIRYRIHPRLGEMESFGRTTPLARDCDSATRAKFWAALAKQPVIIVREDKAVDISFSFEGGRIPRHGGSPCLRSGFSMALILSACPVPGFELKTVRGFGVAIQNPATTAPLVEISLDVDITLPDGSKTICSEKWTGIGDKF